MDKRFGRGQWRALRRRLVWSAGHGKYREIDHARSSLHNAAADASDTILTAATDVSMAYLLFVRMLIGQPLADQFQPALACDDLKDAYHGMPNKASQLRFTIVATKDPKTDAVVFFVAYVHLFGFKLAVGNFYRFPALMTALCRRLGAVMVWHFR